MASIFSKIIAGEIPCYKVAETDKYLAFLDIAPLKRGHTLCIPKIEVDNLFDLDEETYTGLMQFSRRVANAIQKTLPYKRVGVVVAGFEVPHAHVHLIPVNNMKEMDFNNPKVEMVKEEFAAIAMAIEQTYNGI
jgi:histidine triad (HIT) family protein